ncbi:hypothetical protein PHLGIDRAFT_30136 [Phlebiopsis gigantea 11061_1 CR5-6]|uniref:Protein LCHN n=1 Tax=Phlebiopsis gigantea (strain 11061_1 CR5-6) TaxID=745531 RepID=A0A0C3RYH9_PHLG1|nr:hypothetical protein PHLGIDRAFT_30136 [Phlebiopsis gigantea 11061_1 CR5-6]
MSSSEARQRPPQDIVAIFHASFHPTQGNVLDWSLKASEDFDLSHVEFSCLPSGLHLVDQDVVYFSKDSHQGVCIFRRRPTTEHGHRGFRLSSLGILLAKSVRARPWRHVHELKQVLATICQRLDDRYAGDLADSGQTMEPAESDWEPARVFFEERQVRRADLGGAGDWRGWNAEMSGHDCESSKLDSSPPTPLDSTPLLERSQDRDPMSSPTLHLPHLLRALGPSSLTLYKHILGRRRVLIYTAPPVEPACVLCQVAADMCFEAQTSPSSLNRPSSFSSSSSSSKGKFNAESKPSVKVLGVVTLHDLDRLTEENSDGQGWIACTTDAIFLEKPQYYDLLVDLTATPNRGARPTMASSKSAPSPSSMHKGRSFKLSTIRFTWSDIKLWTELDRLMQEGGDDLDNKQQSNCCTPSQSSFYPTSKSQTRLNSITAGFTDIWRVYEDVCVICAGLWLGAWRSPSPSREPPGSRAENWGSVRLTGDDPLYTDPERDELDAKSTKSRVYVRNVGMGIEGRPGGSSPASPVVQEDGILLHRTPKAARRASGSSVWTWTSGRGVLSAPSTTKPSKTGPDADTEEPGRAARRARQVATTLALLRAFQANTDALLARLAEILPERTAHSHNAASIAGTRSAVVLTPKDLVSFDLGPLSGLDGRFVEWLVEVYGNGARVVVRRSWRDVMALIFGLN